MTDIVIVETLLLELLIDLKKMELLDFFPTYDAVALLHDALPLKKQKNEF